MQNGKPQVFNLSNRKNVDGIDISEKKNKPKIVHVAVKAEGEGLAQLVALLRKGLEAPPASSGGE